MLKVENHIEDIICYKCVYFGTISSINEYRNSKKIQMFLLFSELISVFSSISLQIRRHNGMIVMLKVGKHVEDIICYKYAYFGTISCINKYRNSRKIQEFLLFSELFSVFSLFYLQIRREIDCYYFHGSAPLIDATRCSNHPHICTMPSIKTDVLCAGCMRLQPSPNESVSEPSGQLLHKHASLEEPPG